MAVEHINENDTLNAGRVKINAALDSIDATAQNAVNTANQAVSTANNAVSIANDAKTQAQSTQTQLDNIIIENGQSDAEVVQARTKADGTTFPLLKDRLNDFDNIVEILSGKLSNAFIDANKDFNCIADGITDDTIALRNALTEAKNKQATLKLNGTYRITDEIVIDGNSVRIDGSSTWGTRIVCDGTNARLKLVNSSQSPKIYGIELINLDIDGNGKATNPLLLENVSECFLSNIRVRNSISVGIKINSSSICRFLNVASADNPINLQLSDVYNFDFIACNFYNASIAHVQFLNSIIGISFPETWFEDAPIAFLFDNTDAPITIHSLNVSGTYMIFQPANALVAKIISTNTSNRILIRKFMLEKSRIWFEDATNYAFNVNFGTQYHAGNFIFMTIRDNLFANRPDAYIVNSDTSLLRVIYEDNDLTKNIPVLNGSGTILGFDRSGLYGNYKNQIIGKMSLPTSGVGAENEISWNSTAKRIEVHDGTSVRVIPYRAASQADSTATDVATLKNDFNALLQKLRAANILAP